LPNEKSSYNMIQESTCGDVVDEIHSFEVHGNSSPAVQMIVTAVQMIVTVFMAPHLRPDITGSNFKSSMAYLSRNLTDDTKSANLDLIMRTSDLIMRTMKIAQSWKRR
jgi:hypothetical protein